MASCNLILVRSRRPVYHRAMKRLSVISLFVIITLLAACDREQNCRWQLVDGHFYNYEAMSATPPMSTTFLLDTHTGKVWYAAPASTKYAITPEFKPVYIDTSKLLYSGPFSQQSDLQIQPRR